MKKHSLLLAKFAIGLTIFFGVLLILFANENSFKKIVADDIQNISKLSSSIIYAEIDNNLTKPIFVSLTMANDLFLKNWLADEIPSGDDAGQTKTILQYLSNYKEKYGYESIFLVSNKSNVYYSQEGVNKVVSPKNAHDIWYYKFINSGDSYDLDVDFDEVNNNQLTVFANCRINDSGGNLLGVVGVGIKMTHLQELLKKYETTYDLRAFLMNSDGLIQIDSIEENIETSNFFDNQEVLALKNNIINSKDDLEIFWYPENKTDHCLITKYVDTLDWYLVIDKNTSRTQALLSSQINRDLLPIAAIIFLVLFMISCIIGKYNRMLLKTASIDDVTGLPNVKMFQDIFNKNSKRPACGQGTLFMFDIDHFKDINDRFGHLFGNTVLYRISEISKEIIGNKGLVARWGGDEFIGVIYSSPEIATELLQKIVTDISKMQELNDVTISLGATKISASSSLNNLIKEADTALYSSKNNGRNQISYF